MVGGEYSTNIFKSLNFSIGIVMRNPEMLKFNLNHLKTKKICKHAVKNLPFQIKSFFLHLFIFLINTKHKKCVTV